ncbi:RecX family transcriptional regulator [Sphingomonas yunnanensis]|nr:RecX family transcriptional regulator [Sphingomonas yunnanensis]MBY9063273.1 RecX family transcriptional regulator [Sphingomonas yunnanensis]
MAVSLSSTTRRRPPPLDQAGLERLALRYVERFATTRGKLSAYLTRKIRERGWEGEPADPDGVAERMAALGYVDDRGFAEQKGAALGRRGYGARRVAETLRAAGLDAADAAPVLAQAQEGALESALRLARRKRIGPFAETPADAAQRARQLGQLLRAGHAPPLARRIVEARPGAILDEE